jgi:hypothetical protein
MLCKIRGLFIEKVEFGFSAELAKEIEAARARTKLPAPTAVPALVIEGSFTADKAAN